MTHGGHRSWIGHFSLHDPMTDNRSHETSAVPEGYLVSHLATEASKEGTRAGGSSHAATATCNFCLLLRSIQNHQNLDVPAISRTNFTIGRACFLLVVRPLRSLTLSPDQTKREPQ